MYTEPFQPQGPFAVNLNIPLLPFELDSPPCTDIEIRPILYRKPSIEDLIHHHLTLGPWAGYFPSGCPIFLLYKVEPIVLSASWGGCKD